MVANHGYYAKKLYYYSKGVLGIDLVCPIKRYKKIPRRGLSLYAFMNLKWGRLSTYHQKVISVEPLIEHIKSIFRINPLPIYGFHTVSAIVLISVLLYQMMVYYNCKKDKPNPKSIKYMLGIV